MKRRTQINVDGEEQAVMEIICRNICPNCGYKGAIKWNPYNQVCQCHNCGQIVRDGNEKVIFT